MQYVWAAFVLDFILGDPEWFHHPIRFIGRLIKALEKAIRFACKSNNQLIFGGALVVLICITVVFFLTFIILQIAKAINPWVYIIVNVLLMYFAIAAKCLKNEGARIRKYLINGDMENARKYLGFIVGRDVDKLEMPEIVRGTVETIAENTSDGVIAPLFYMIIGGAPLAMAYKAINTMDSMIGYKNEKYLYFGKAAAILDDIVNFVPARITGYLMVVGAVALRLDWKSSFKILKRDNKKHSSPNSGYPEAAAAGALGVRLGGSNSYFGVQSQKPFIGERTREFEVEDISRVSRLMYATTILFLYIATIIFWKGF